MKNDPWSGDPREPGDSVEWINPKPGRRFIGYVESLFVSKQGKNYTKFRHVVTLSPAGDVINVSGEMLANGMTAPAHTTDVGSIGVVTVSLNKTRQGRDGREYPVTKFEVIPRGSDSFRQAAQRLAELIQSYNPRKQDDPEQREIPASDDDLPF